MAARQWNARPSAYAATLGASLDRASALHSLGVYSAVALAAGAGSRYGLPLLAWLRVPHASVIAAGLALGALLGVLAAVNTLRRWRDSSARTKAQAGLQPRQRELLGLPPMPPAKPGSIPPDAAPAAARAAALLATPVSPAQRPMPLTPSAGVSDVTPRSLLATPGSAGRSSLAASPGSRLSPWSVGPAVATPEQLATYLDAFGRGDTAGQADAAAAAAAAGSPPPPLPAGQQQQHYFDGSDQGAGGGPALPLGRDAPAYRPSLLARKVAAAAAGAGGGEGLQPSADAEAGRIMREILQIEVPELLVWIERFREWLSRALLAPLASLMETAHEEPNALLATLVPGQQAPQLPAITALLELDTRDEQPTGAGLAGGTTTTTAGAERTAGVLSFVSQALLGPVMTALGAGGGAGQGGGAGAGGGATGAAGGASAAEDARNVALGLMDSLRRSQLPYGYNPEPLLLALHRYSELLLLLSGRRPSELLPPAPPSYIASRVRQLATGTCAKAFNWGGGGDHAGRPWSPELPSDSGLLLYLVAAFLDAPGWNFLPPGAGGVEASRGAPLYLGSLRSRPPGAYSALLAFRPDKPGPGAVAVIGSNLASRSPRFSLLLAGQLVTLCERDGLFKVLLMWLQFHLVERAGLVGGRQLSDAALGGLDAVLVPVSITPSVPQRVFTWWFPAAR